VLTCRAAGSGRTRSRRSRSTPPSRAARLASTKSPRGTSTRRPSSSGALSGFLVTRVYRVLAEAEGEAALSVVRQCQRRRCAPPCTVYHTVTCKRALMLREACHAASRLADIEKALAEQPKKVAEYRVCCTAAPYFLCDWRVDAAWALYAQQVCGLRPGYCKRAHFCHLSRLIVATAGPHSSHRSSFDSGGRGA